MIMKYQQEMKMQRKKPKPMEFATIAKVYDDGITLILDGKESMKRYKWNKSLDDVSSVLSKKPFAAGQRVKLSKVSGTYIVEYRI